MRGRIEEYEEEEEEEGEENHQIRNPVRNVIHLGQIFNKYSAFW